jgi:hypothetical protein
MFDVTNTINSDYKTKQRELVGTQNGDAALLLYGRKRIHKYNRHQFYLQSGLLRCYRICLA